MKMNMPRSKRREPLPTKYIIKASTCKARHWTRKRWQVTSTPMAFSSLLSLLLLFIPFLFFKLLQWRRYKLPPGPKPWPVVGNLFDIKPVRFRCFAEWAMAYGPIVSVWFGWRLNVVASSSELAKEVLKEKDQLLADRPRDKAVQYLSRNGQDLIWADYGPHYVKVRKVCMLELFTPKRLESLRPIRKDEVTAMVEAIFRDCTKPGMCKLPFVFHNLLLPSIKQLSPSHRVRLPSI